MHRDQLLTRISIDPKICSGKPCVRGDRIGVSQILDLLASGETLGQVLEAYPSLEEADVFACIAYGAEMAERCVCLRVRQMQTGRARPL
jgi:uncharacterized protein (DUF433 family)